MTRVAVFIDYQNVYHCAREAFGAPQHDPPTFGHVRPQRLALLLKQLGEEVDPRRELCAVAVYRGQPPSQVGLTSRFRHPLEAPVQSDSRRSPTGICVGTLERRESLEVRPAAASGPFLSNTGSDLQVL